MEATAGQKIADCARRAMAKALGHNCPIEAIPTDVKPKADGNAGQWFCVDCGAFPENNMQAAGHNKKHRLAWRNFTTGDIEQP